MFTSLLVYQLIEKGKLDLEKSINNYIPEYKLPNDREIKIKNLLSHTSGFEDFIVITSYSIHYTKLYDSAKDSAAPV